MFGISFVWILITKLNTWAIACEIVYHAYISVLINWKLFFWVQSNRTGAQTILTFCFIRHVEHLLNMIFGPAGNCALQEVHHLLSVLLRGVVKINALWRHTDINIKKQEQYRWASDYDYNTASEEDGKYTMDLFDAHCVLMQLVLQNQLLQVVKCLFVDSLKKEK